MDKIINSIMENIPVIILILPLYILLQKLSSSFNSFVEMYIKSAALRKTGNSIPNELKINACERLTLLIERITPESLILRNNKGNLNNRELQIILLEEIRNEFDHNLTQRLYVSDETWNACESAKNSVSSIINTVASKCDPQGDAMEISNLIMQVYMSNNDSINTAKSLIKKELV